MRENELSKTQRECIIGAYLSSTKQRVISTQLGIPISTVNDTIKRYKETGDVTNKLNTSLNTTLHYNTVRSYLHNEGLGSYTARKKSRLTVKHQTDRLGWCRRKQNWTEEWKQVVWSDESRFALFQSDGRARVWRSPKETYNKDCIQPTVKFGEASVMF